MILLYFLLIATVFASGSLVFFIKPENQKVVKLLLSFSGAFLMGICFLMLIPEVFSSPAKYAGLFVLFGFILQLFLEVITV